MLTIIIEMWPGGNEMRSHEIGRMYVWNVSNLAKISNYKGVVCRRGKFEHTREAMEKATRKLEVKGYPRERLNVWCLVTRALLSAFPEENRRAVRGAQKDDELRAVAEELHLAPEASIRDILDRIDLLKKGGTLPPAPSIPLYGEDPLT